MFHALRLPDGGTRGFVANATTYAVDGTDPWVMGGARTAVLGPGVTNSFSECGRWLNATFLSGAVLSGFIHAESSCDYAHGQTHKSFAYATSSTLGLSWSAPQQILTGKDVPRTGAITGEGDCSVVTPGDGYLYAYCLRAADWRTIVARAPVATPGSGWVKYLDGGWTSPGIGGDATALGNLGVGGAYVAALQSTALLGIGPSGVRLSLARDGLRFDTLAEPLVPLVDGQDWNRPAGSELFAYLSAVNPATAGNSVGLAFMLTHVYLEPGAAFDSRYLVSRTVTLTPLSAPEHPQVGVALSRWSNATRHDRWTTTAPVPGNFGAYAYDSLLGYLLTAPHPTLATVKLEDCALTSAMRSDHLLTNDGTCAAGNFDRLRTAGWLFLAAQPGTVPVYRCYDATWQAHFAATTSNCDGLGTMEWRLGYALAP